MKSQAVTLVLTFLLTLWCAAQEVPSTPTQAQPELELWEPDNEYILFDPNKNNSAGRWHGELEVTNGNYNHAIVKLVRTDGNRKILSFLVRGNSAIAVDGIPDGSYWLFFSFGNRVIKGYDRFYLPVSSSKFLMPVNFSTYSSDRAVHYTSLRITLHAVHGGEAKTTKIDNEIFDKY